MGLGLNINMGLGLGRQGGGGESYVNPDIPAVENIVRAWSLRRNVPAFAGGNGILIKRSDSGGETPAPFGASGTLSISGAEEARVPCVYDQAGNLDASRLLNSVWPAQPQVYNSTDGVLKGLKFGGAQMLQVAANGEDVISALRGDGHTVSLWFYTTATEIRYILYMREETTRNYLGIALISGKVYSYIRKAAVPAYSSATYYSAWTHVCVTRTGQAGTVNGHKLYINGVAPSGTLDQDVEVDSATSGAGDALTIGATAAGGSMFDGMINDIIIWNTDLTAPQVTALYNAQKAYYGL